jgi:hypothetical protein
MPAVGIEKRPSIVLPRRPATMPSAPDFGTVTEPLPISQEGEVVKRTAIGRTAL